MFPRKAPAALLDSDLPDEKLHAGIVALVALIDRSLWREGQSTPILMVGCISFLFFFFFPDRLTRCGKPWYEVASN